MHRTTAENKRKIKRNRKVTSTAVRGPSFSSFDVRPSTFNLLCFLLSFFFILSCRTLTVKLQNISTCQPCRQVLVRSVALRGGTAKKGKKGKQSMLNMHSTNELLKAGLQKAHEGKRILLSSRSIYKPGQIPEGEENSLWQYSVLAINDDCKTAVIEFDERYIEEGGDQFLNHANVDDDDEGMTIKDYKLEGLKDDHEVFNVHLHRVNKAINDLKDAKLKEEEAKKARSCDSIDDLVKKAEERCTPYSLLLAEFESFGDLQEHRVASGGNVGKVNYKQMWRHTHSGYSFMWHRQFGKAAFERSKLWKAARAIISTQAAGHQRLMFIMKYSKKPLNSSDGNEPRPREQDRIHRVGAVMALGTSKSVLSLFDGIGMREYIEGLDSKHTPPHCLERIRLLEVIMDRAMMEFRLINDVGHLQA